MEEGENACNREPNSSGLFVGTRSIETAGRWEVRGVDVVMVAILMCLLLVVGRRLVLSFPFKYR